MRMLSPLRASLTMSDIGVIYPSPGQRFCGLMISSSSASSAYWRDKLRLGPPLRGRLTSVSWTAGCLRVRGDAVVGTGWRESDEMMKAINKK